MFMGNHGYVSAEKKMKKKFNLENFFSLWSWCTQKRGKKKDIGIKMEKDSKNELNELQDELK